MSDTIKEKKIRKVYTLQPDNKFEDVEYIELTQNKKTVHTFPSNEIEGITKYELQKKIGDMFGTGKFFASVKYNGQYSNKRFPIKGLILGTNTMSNNTDQSISKDEIEKLLKNNSNNNNSGVIEVLKLTYANQIDSLKEVIKDLKDTLRDRDKEISKTNDIINSLKDQIRDLEINESKKDEGGGLLEMVSQLAALKSGGLSGLFGSTKTPVLTSINSDPSDIPPEFINALGKVDFSKISDEQKKQYVNVFNQFANQLPLKQGELS